MNLLSILIVDMLNTIAQVLPLVIFYLFFASPDDFLYSSIHPLGRLFAITLILLYSVINTYYGILMCALVIFYYKMDFVEKTSMFDSYMLIGDKFYEPFEIEQKVKNKVDEFREQNCKTDNLEFKEKSVKNENACHIFPELKFLEEPCNPCDKQCGITINEKLKNEENMVYPKQDDDWVFQIWKTWFSEDNLTPSPKQSTYGGFSFQ